MDLIIKVNGSLEAEINDCMIDLDIVTCECGQCLKDPAPWTPQEVVSILISEYLKEYRGLVGMRPLHPRVAKHIRPKTGRR